MMWVVTKLTHKNTNNELERNMIMAKECNCDVAEDTHEHCIECEHVLCWHESENLCRWCEERITDESNTK
jgi:hypothetical protein